eukprot:TRINITY_DN22023_c0_g2_i1.p1 TRINITY_DN22023_c0_g2~~TRINITY_DN22023_c0_g2_i1.p1  ORF type:complete len:268 (+),score=25.64 TRINITY_DN22023_c0_g2_i1:82-804(+)
MEEQDFHSDEGSQAESGMGSQINVEQEYQPAQEYQSQTNSQQKEESQMQLEPQLKNMKSQKIVRALQREKQLGLDDDLPLSLRQVILAPQTAGRLRIIKKYHRWKIEKELAQAKAKQEKKQKLANRLKAKKHFKPCKCRYCSKRISAMQQFKYKHVSESQMCQSHINEKMVLVEGEYLRFCRYCMKWLSVAQFPPTDKAVRCRACVVKDKIKTTAQAFCPICKRAPKAKYRHETDSLQVL